MRIALIRLCAAEYPMHLANALADEHKVYLFLTRRNLAVRYPDIADIKEWLKEKQVLKPQVHLELLDYPEGSYARKPFWALKFMRQLRHLGPDVVHYHSCNDPWIPLALPLLGNVPLVLSVHDATQHTGDFPPPFVQRSITRFVAQHADQIIVHGHEQAQVLCEQVGVPTAKVNVVPLGGYSIFRKLAKDNLAEEPNLVLFFGRIRAYKGLKYLIEAAPTIAEAVPDVRFLIAGSGEGLEEFDDSLGNNARFIIYNHFIPMDEVGGLFQRAAVVALPYTDASQSGVVPLAYVFGKPVIATCVGSIPEVVDDGKTGYLIEPRNSQQLATAIIKLLQDHELRQQMGRNAMHKIETDLSWECISTKTVQVYTRAIQARCGS